MARQRRTYTNEFEVEAVKLVTENGRSVAEADPARRAIRKVRHVFPFAGHVLELDVFAEPPGLVLLEVELEDASDVPALPPVILVRLVREVSLESAYMNHEIALRPPADG